MGKCQREKGAKLLETKAWGDVLDKAEGVVKRDDPALLKKKLKAEERAKKKSAAAWAERTKAGLAPVRPFRRRTQRLRA